MCKVVNKYWEPHEVYIGRGSIWGNPFRMASEADRVTVVAKHKQHLWKQIKDGVITKQMLLSLDGKRLGCYCAPKACHGDNIVKAVKWAKREVNGKM